MKLRIPAVLLAVAHLTAVSPTSLAETDTHVIDTAAIENMGFNENFLDDVFNEAVNILQTSETDVEPNGFEASVTLNEAQPITESSSDESLTQELSVHENEFTETEPEFEIMATGTYYEEYGLYFDESRGTVTGYGEDLPEKLTIPETINGVTVTRIDSHSIKSCDKLKELNIPKTVSYIGYSSFQDCTNLEKVTFNYNDEREFKLTIDPYAFAGCPKITSLELPETVTKLGQCFIEGTSIESITIPASVKDSYIFSMGILANCETLKTVIFAEGATIIPYGICAADVGYGKGVCPVETIVIPDTVTQISTNAFNNCDSLKEINIPKNISKVDSYAFTNCDNLEKITFNYNDEREFKLTIDDYVFSGCPKITSLELPETVTTLGQCFIEGTSIESITIPASVTDVSIHSMGILANCETLKTVIFAEGTTALPYAICAADVGHGKGVCNVETVVIPDSVKKISTLAFSNCDSLREFDIPKSTEVIEVSAFENCDNLERVTFNYNPDKTLEIQNEAFKDCKKIKNIDLPNHTVKLGQEFIAGTSVESITIPASVVNTSCYNTGVLANCKTLTTVVFADGATVIPYAMCSSDGYESYIENIIIPDTVKEIQSNAFYHCNILKSITLPESLEIIGWSAFAECEVLEEINIPANVREIDYNAFENCSALTKVTLNDNYTYNSELEICNDAFAGCQKLTELYLPIQTTYLGERFIKDTRISEITIPKALESASCPFAGAIYLDNVYFQSGLKSIPYNMCDPYGYTSYICHVEIPPSVTEIGDNAFYDCDKLVIYCYPNSYAHTYAVENGIPYELLEYSNIINNSDWTYASGGGGVGRLPAADASASNNSLGITQKNLKPITTGSDKLRGPKITIAGKSFYLFELPIDMSIKTPLYSVTYNHKEEKFELILGSLDKATLKGYGGSTAVYRNIKEFVNTTGIGNTKSAPKLINAMKSQKMDFGFDFNATPAGYMEFDKNLNLTSGAIIYMLELDVNMKTPLPPAPVIYVKVGLEADAMGKLGIKKVETNAYSIFGAVDIGVGPYVGIGAGSSSIANIEAGAKLKLNAKTSIELGQSLKNSLTADITGSLYFKLKALMFINFSDSWDLTKLSLYPDFNASLMSIQSIDEMTVMPRDYINSPSEFTANNEMSVMGIDEINISSFKTNVFPNAEPQLVQLNDGRELMVWLEDDTTRTDINRTVLKYSLNEYGNWTDPENVHSIATADFSPKLAVTENGAMLVWQKTNSVMSDDATLSDMAADTDIYYSAFDGSSWSEPEQLTYDNDVYEFGVDVASDGTNATVTWIENSENDCFALSGTNTVKYLSYDGEWWDMESSEVASELGSISNLGVCYFGEKPAIAYITDTDNNPETTDDSELYEYLNCELLKISDDTVTDYAMSVNDNGYTWIHGDQVWERSASGIEQLELPVNPLMLNKMRVLSNGYDRVVVWEQSEDYATELYAIYYDNDDKAWGEPIKLTNDGKKIRESSGYLNADGNIRLVFGQAEIDENNEYGQCNLMLADITEHTDIQVLSTVCEYATYEKGGDATITTTVQNNGSSKITAFDVVVTADGKTIASKWLATDVPSGSTANLVIPFTLPDSLSNKTYAVTVTPNDYDYDESNNSATFELGLADLEITNVQYDGEKVTAKVYNYGYLASENTVCYLISSNGDILEEKEIGTIAARKSANIEFTSTAADNATIYVTSDNDEAFYDNNTETVLNMNIHSTEGTHIELVSCDTNQTVLSANATVVNYDDTSKTVDIFAAAYKDGALQKVVCKQITLDADSSQEVPYTFGVYDADTVKIFAWDTAENMCPNGTSKTVAISYDTEE